MAAAHRQSDPTLWRPTSAQVPEEWMSLANKLAEEAKGFPRAYVLTARYDAQRVGDLLRSWGLPWQVVMAGYLWEYEKDWIRQAYLENVDQVLGHINESNLYASYIENENLSPLLTPPYRDLGALLAAVAIYYQALQILQEQSNERPYPGTMQSNIESVGRTLLNITKSLGMWHFKREVEDLIEQLRSPRKFAELKKEHARLLEQDTLILEDTRQWLIASYQEATGQPVTILSTPCGIAGLKRRLQGADETSQKAQLTGFDLVTFDVIVPTVQDCYRAFGALSQLGYIRDQRVIEEVANPKPNGNSRIAFALILKPQSPYTQGLKWPEIYTRICHLQIATPFMQAITAYGCLHPDYYQLYTRAHLQRGIELPPLGQLWHSEEGKIYLALKEFLATQHPQPVSNAPIVVYDKGRNPIALPKGATALDFAFALDDTTGEHAVEAFINNRQAPLYRTLDAGDIVEIRTSNEIQAQDHWHDNVITQVARQRIKESLDRRYPEHKGYQLLQQLLESYHFMLAPQDLDRELHLLLKQHKLGPLQTYLKRLDKTGKPPFTPDWAVQEIIRQITERDESSLVGKPNWIPILDMDLTTNKRFIHQQYLCNFCKPTYPRDMKIIGRLRKRSGELVVHKASCPHLLDRTKAHQSVLLPMTWQLQPPAFRVAFFVLAQDRKGLILDLAKHLRRHQCDLLDMKAKVVTKFGEARIDFTIDAYSDKEALEIWHELSRIENVTKVEIDAVSTPAHIRDRLQKLRKQPVGLPGKTAVELTWKEAMVTLQPRNPILKNPFDISRPATAKMFFGRSRETERMQRELCEGQQGRAILLYGPRRSGKSSICKNFLERCVRPPYWGALFSLQNFTQHSEAAILGQLAAKICEEFSDQLQMPAPGWDQYSDGDPQLCFRRVVQDCIVQLPGSRLVLALDEFGGAIQSYSNNILAPRFFNFWRELMNEIPQLSLVLALPTSAHNTLRSWKFGNAFSFAEPLPVMFLDTKSAEQLLVDPLRDQNIEVYPTTVALAVKLTGGNPYFMTLIGQQLIDQLNQETDKQLITDNDLRIVVDYLIETGSNQNFVYLRRELQNDDELRILEAMVELTTRSNQSKMQLKKIAAHLDLPITVTRQHLERLRNGLILQENGPISNPFYSFTIELMRLWLAHNHWFFLPSTEQ